MSTYRRRAMAVSAALTVTALPALAAGPVVYPAKGQSEEQQARDKYECHLFAVKQSGFDPTAQAAAHSQPAPAPQGGAVSGAAKGAAVGAIGGAIAGDAGKGAEIGAATGAAGGTMRKHKAAKEAQAAQAKQGQAQADARSLYDRATQACLEGRGYTVK